MKTITFTIVAYMTTTVGTLQNKCLSVLSSGLVLKK